MKAHTTDGLSLTFGVIFLAIVGWWALAKSVDVTLPNLGWFVAGALILLGVLGLLGALRRSKPVTPPEVAEPTLTDTTDPDVLDPDVQNSDRS
jgi:hypothetical protein